MPSCGPVYQPTTVPRSGANGGGGGGFLGPASSVNSPLRIFRRPKLQLCLLLFSLIAVAAGIAMIVSGTADWIDDQEYVEEHENKLPIDGESNTESSETQTEPVQPQSGISLGILLAGIVITCLGLLAMGIYIKVADWRRNCVCPCSCPFFFDKKQSLARQLQCQNVGSGCGQGIMALNPSTDPLVSHTQYAPVSELPSLRADEEERRPLQMPDNKDCLSSAEESDRMLEPDPRIVLRPIGRVEEA